MTARWLAAVLACAGAVAPGGALAAEREMTFEEVIVAALEAPRSSRLAAELQSAEAQVASAETYPYNPVLEIEGADRSGAAGSTTDRSAGISQQLELAGQRGKRRAAAGSALDSARGVASQARRELVVEAALAFVRAANGRDLVAVERAEAELARSFATLVERRLEAGSATAVDLALAQAGLARAERALALSEGGYRTAQARLAELIGIPGTAFVTSVGEPPDLPAPPELGQALDLTIADRGDLAAARAQVAAAEARLRLARSERIPDLTVAARAAREEGEDVVGLGFALPLPLFQRNQGAIAAAEAELATARADLAVTELAVRREVAAAHARLEAALEARGLAERLGVTPLEEGLTLLERSFEEGKIGAAELLVYRRELVEGRRQSVAADAEAWEATAALAIAVGAPLPGLEWIDRQEQER